MNGVRRFLGGGGGKSAGLPPTPPPSDRSGGLPSPINTTMPLFSNRSAPNWPPITPADGSFSPQIQSSVYSPTSPGTPLGLKSLPRVPPPPMPREYQDEAPVPTMNGGFAPTAPLNFGGPSRAAASVAPLQPAASSGPRQTNGIPPAQRPAMVPVSSPPTRGLPELDLREEMLISLLASDAVIDSKDMHVLSFEEVEDLKKVCALAPHLARALVETLPVSLQQSSACLMECCMLRSLCSLGAEDTPRRCIGCPTRWTRTRPFLVAVYLRPFAGTTSYFFARSGASQEARSRNQNPRCSTIAAEPQFVLSRSVQAGFRQSRRREPQGGERAARIAPHIRACERGQQEIA